MCFFTILFLCCLLCSVRFGLFCTMPRDWLGRTSPKWRIILCRLRHETSTHSFTYCSANSSLSSRLSFLSLFDCCIIIKWLFTRMVCDVADVIVVDWETGDWAHRRAEVLRLDLVRFQRRARRCTKGQLYLTARLWPGVADRWWYVCMPYSWFWCGACWCGWLDSGSVRAHC